jgi:hypothetical protein
MAEKQVKIQICEEIGSKSAISTNDGDAIFMKIDAVITDGKKANLDFNGIDL